MKKNVLLFPYSSEVSALVNTHCFPDTWNIVGAIIPFKKECFDSFYLSEDFESSLHLCDTVFFISTDVMIPGNLLKQHILKAISFKKSIYCSFELNKKDLGEVQEAARRNNIQFVYIKSETEPFETIPDELMCNEKTPFLKEIQTPIVSFFSTIEYCNKIAYSLSLVKFFRQKGYKVAYMLPRSYAKLIGALSIPDFMYTEISELKKIINLNNYIHEIEYKERPDVFIVVVPGGILPINKNYLNNFGILAFEMTRAFKSDVNILCSHFVDAREEYFLRLSELMRHRFSAKPDAFIIDNTYLEFYAQGYPDEIDLLEYDDSVYSLIDRKMKEYSYNIYLKNEMESLAQLVLKKLTSSITFEL